MGVALGCVGASSQIKAGIHTVKIANWRLGGSGKIALVPSPLRVFGVRSQHFIQDLGHCLFRVVQAGR